MHSSNNVLLIKPAKFSYNIETAKSNAFQNSSTTDKREIVGTAILEFDRMVQELIQIGVNVTVLDDTETPIKPDAIFPNNWVSFHANGTVVLYPMLAKNRRKERRVDVIKTIRENFEINKIIDLSIYEKKNIFLEGTGSIIFDHTHKIAYACISPRTDKQLFEKTCKILDYKPICFQSVDAQRKEIYHTNVMMNIGNGYSVICLESIKDKNQREIVSASLTKSGHKIIDISYDQTSSFCGNMLELELLDKKNILAMSRKAYQSLTATQKSSLEEFCKLFPLTIDTIERVGGGSVRCMIAEIFLPLRT